ncbi:glycosyl hydrolase [Alteromonas sp. ASW11-36]|uniref:Endo-1,3-beta-glucanase btgC n=1 Tax=Alteromonas arenosi TaxID=3055817 RepID=A0ABT7SZB9_9ALTE|nr:glycosyl hydrolase [Alteromonas sp. ASW11-36]MDM7861510.1 glycosyl hydrolase [Alteromonas sp. ASW11-36]
MQSNNVESIGILLQRAICYSGYRDGHNPGLGIFPSYSQILEDLQLLAGDWQYLRLYDAGPHAHTVLEVIEREQLPFKVLLGMDLAAEVSNPNCPWDAYYPDHKLADNRRHNDTELQRVVRLANEYSEHVLAISIGNEASVDWTDHKVETHRLVHFAVQLKGQTQALVTFCENYVPWANGQLDELAKHVDFLSIHSYPLWESQSIEHALHFTQQNYYEVADRFSDKPVVITEAGWTTNANGHAFPAHFANERWQSDYCAQLLNWCEKDGILCFLFEAFDESWKGSDDPAEPEKHWGIFRLNRQPKPVVIRLQQPQLASIAKLSNNG